MEEIRARSPFHVLLAVRPPSPVGELRGRAAPSFPPSCCSLATCRIALVMTSSSLKLGGGAGISGGGVKHGGPGRERAVGEDKEREHIEEAGGSCRPSFSAGLSRIK
jgi:hypothetical protein